MGWEEDYEDKDWGLDDLNEIDPTIKHVDKHIMEERVAPLLQQFHDKFGYGLLSEIPSKTVQFNLDRGYIAAHFTPIDFNSKLKYYTLMYNEDFRIFPDAFQFTLEFTDSFLMFNGQENMSPNTNTVISANNFDSIIEYLLDHWVKNETVR